MGIPLGTVLVVAAIVGVSVPLAAWITGAHMTKLASLTWRWGSSKDFWEEFRKHNWEVRYGCKHSLFADGYFFDRASSAVHLGVVRFNGVGMVLYPWSWIRVSVGLRIYRRGAS